MLQMAKEYNTNLAAIKMSPTFLHQLPAWYHLLAEHCHLNRNSSKCPLRKHNVTKVTHLVRALACIRNPQQNPEHEPEPECACQECTEDWTNGCENPYECATEALIRLNQIPPKHNPMRQDPPRWTLVNKNKENKKQSSQRDRQRNYLQPNNNMQRKPSRVFQDLYRSIQNHKPTYQKILPPRTHPTL